MKRNFLLFVVLFLTLIANVYAGGFQVNLQGVKQAGMGHCGTAYAKDNAIVFFNPGGMSFSDSSHSFSINVLPVFARTLYQRPQSNYAARTENNTGTPFSIYGLFRYNKFSIGLAAYTPFGSTLNWPEDWQGKFLLTGISLGTVFYQPTISYRIHENISIGAGFIFATGNFSLSRKLPVQMQNGEWGNVLLEGEARGYGFNAGIFFNLSEKLNLGLSYRSKVNANVENGVANFTVPEMLIESFPAKIFTTSLSLPSVLNSGINYAINDKWKILSDFNFIGWKVYDSLVIDFDINTERLSDLRSARNYKNSFIFRLGTETNITKNFQLRGGIYFDQSPVRRGYLTPETPDSDKLGITCGLSYQIKRYSFDFALMYIEGMRREDINLETGFEAIYKSKAVVPALSVRINY